MAALSPVNLGLGKNRRGVVRAGDLAVLVGFDGILVVLG